MICATIGPFCVEFNRRRVELSGTNWGNGRSEELDQRHVPLSGPISEPVWTQTRVKAGVGEGDPVPQVRLAHSTGCCDWQKLDLVTNSPFE